MELCSYHVFLFPFQWQYTGNGFEKKTFEDRTSLDNFETILKNTRWKTRPFTPDTILKYNEYNYFYDFVRNILYDNNDREQSGKESFISHYYFDIEPETLSYTIRIKNKAETGPATWEYRLLIDSIILNLYSTGVGVISFHLCNREVSQSSQSDILRINQYGRRLYPPFFGIDPNRIGTLEQFSENDFEAGLKFSRGKELADSITVGFDSYTEDYSEYNNSNHFQTNPFQIPKIFSFLFEGVPFTTNKNSMDDNSGIFISPLFDDRMFVICWYGNNKLAKELKKSTGIDKSTHEEHFAYKTDDWWYQFLFVDGGFRTCQNAEMLYRFLNKQTNARWIEFGTLFGVSRYSFVCLTQDLPTLRSNNSAFLVNHVQTMYYKMVELCLVQRACLLRFSDEVTRLSSLKVKHDADLPEKVNNFYKQYIRFINKIHFREITAQEQGTELYNLLHEQMHLEQNVKDLDAEIEELHNYVMLLQEKKQSRNIELLTIIGALFILPTFVVNFFGMIIMPQKAACPNPQAILLLIPLLVAPVIYFLLDRQRAKKWFMWLILFTLLATILIIVTMYFGDFTYFLNTDF